jgi:hypothetical protein
MSTQSDYDKNKKALAAAEKKVTNARTAADKKTAAKNAIKSLYIQIRLTKLNNINPALVEIKNLEATIAIRQRQWNLDYKARLAINNPLTANDILALKTDFVWGSNETDRLLKVVKQYKDRIKKANAEIDDYRKKIEDLTPITLGQKPLAPPKPTVLPTTPAVTAPSFTFSTDYKYNAPMVTSAYLRNGIQADSISGSSIFNSETEIKIPGTSINYPMFLDARNAWKGINGGKGTVQMDKQLINRIAEQQGTSSIKFDRQLYGFKFMYNPTSVSMAWDISDKMSPTFIGSGEDKFNPIAAGLLSSVVEFELYLNRIADFGQVGEGGIIVGANPYPVGVPPEDLSQIYEKGTMYDLEYLFKTLNGPNATFTSPLNGITADRGWLRPTIVELHLGKSMRYRVRIADFAVNHLIFNNNMVPIFSTVKLTCRRFNDSPDYFNSAISSNSNSLNNQPSGRKYD